LLVSLVRLARSSEIAKQGGQPGLICQLPHGETERGPSYIARYNPVANAPLRRVFICTCADLII
jgi:hypothetical protein